MTPCAIVRLLASTQTNLTIRGTRIIFPSIAVPHSTNSPSYIGDINRLSTLPTSITRIEASQCSLLGHWMRTPMQPLSIQCHLRCQGLFRRPGHTGLPLKFHLHFRPVPNGTLLGHQLQLVVLNPLHLTGHPRTRLPLCLHLSGPCKTYISPKPLKTRSLHKTHRIS